MIKITKLTKFTLLLIALTTMMSNVAIVTVIPHMKEIFSHEPNIELLSRLMITLPSLMIAILAPFLGHLIHHIGKKISALFALVLFGISGSAGLYLDSIESLLTSRAILGIAIAALMIVSTALVGDYFKAQDRHKFMGIQSAFTSIGGIIFVVGGGVLSDIDWRYPFGIYLIGFILLPFVVKFFIERNKNDKDFDNDLEELNPRLFHIYFLAFLLMAIFYILPTQIPFLMMNEFGASGALTGSIISIAFVFHAFGSLTFAKMKQKIEYKTIYLIGLAIIASGFVFIGFISNIYLFFFSASMLGFGGGMMMTNVNAWMLSRAHSSKRVKSSGYMTSSFFMGQFFSPIFTMPIVSSFGVQNTFLILGGTIFFGIGISSFIVYKN